MDLTDNLALPIPEADDTGATALYLERLAKAADARLGAYLDEMDAFLKPPTIVTTAQSASIISWGAEYSFQGDLWASSGSSVVFSNQPTTIPGDFPVPGWWSFGVSRVASTPASTQDNAVFALILDAYSFDVNPGRTTVLYRVTRPYSNSSTGPEAGQISGEFYVPPGVRVFARVSMYHDHPVERTVQAGTVAWRTYLGSGDAAQRGGSA